MVASLLGERIELTVTRPSGPIRRTTKRELAGAALRCLDDPVDGVLDAVDRALGPAAKRVWVNRSALPLVSGRSTGVTV